MFPTARIPSEPPKTVAETLPVFNAAEKLANHPSLSELQNNSLDIECKAHERPLRTDDIGPYAPVYNTFLTTLEELYNRNPDMRIQFEATLGCEHVICLRNCAHWFQDNTDTKERSVSGQAFTHSGYGSANDYTPSFVPQLQPAKGVRFLKHLARLDCERKTACARNFATTEALVIGASGVSSSSSSSSSSGALRHDSKCATSMIIDKLCSLADDRPFFETGCITMFTRFIDLLEIVGTMLIAPSGIKWQLDADYHPVFFRAMYSHLSLSLQASLDIRYRNERPTQFFIRQHLYPALLELSLMKEVDAEHKVQRVVLCASTLDIKINPKSTTAHLEKIAKMLLRALEVHKQGKSRKQMPAEKSYRREYGDSFIALRALFEDTTDLLTFAYRFISIELRSAEIALPVHMHPGIMMFLLSALLKTLPNQPNTPEVSAELIRPEFVEICAKWGVKMTQLAAVFRKLMQELLPPLHEDQSWKSDNFVFSFLYALNERYKRVAFRRPMHITAARVVGSVPQHLQTRKQVQDVLREHGHLAHLNEIDAFIGLCEAEQRRTGSSEREWIALIVWTFNPLDLQRTYEDMCQLEQTADPRSLKIAHAFFETGCGLVFRVLPLQLAHGSDTPVSLVFAPRMWLQALNQLRYVLLTLECAGGGGGMAGHRAAAALGHPHATAQTFSAASIIDVHLRSQSMYVRRAAYQVLFHLIRQPGPQHAHDETPDFTEIQYAIDQLIMIAAIARTPPEFGIGCVTKVRATELRKNRNLFIQLIALCGCYKRLFAKEAARDSSATITPQQWTGALTFFHKYIEDVLAKCMEFMHDRDNVSKFLIDELGDFILLRRDAPSGENGKDAKDASSSQPQVAETDDEKKARLFYENVLDVVIRPAVKDISGMFPLAHPCTSTAARTESTEERKYLGRSRSDPTKGKYHKDTIRAQMQGVTATGSPTRHGSRVDASGADATLINAFAPAYLVRDGRVTQLPPEHFSMSNELSKIVRQVEVWHDSSRAEKTKRGVFDELCGNLEKDVAGCREDIFDENLYAAGDPRQFILCACHFALPIVHLRDVRLNAHYYPDDQFLAAVDLPSSHPSDPLRSVLQESLVAHLAHVDTADLRNRINYVFTGRRPEVPAAAMLRPAQSQLPSVNIPVPEPKVNSALPDVGAAAGAAPPQSLPAVQMLPGLSLVETPGNTTSLPALSSAPTEPGVPIVPPSFEPLPAQVSSATDRSRSPITTLSHEFMCIAVTDNKKTGPVAMEADSKDAKSDTQPTQQEQQQDHLMPQAEPLLDLFPLNPSVVQPAVSPHKNLSSSSASSSSSSSNDQQKQAESPSKSRSGNKGTKRKSQEPHRNNSSAKALRRESDNGRQPRTGWAQKSRDDHARKATARQGELDNKPEKERLDREDCERKERQRKEREREAERAEWAINSAKRAEQKKEDKRREDEQRAEESRAREARKRQEEEDRRELERSVKAKQIDLDAAGQPKPSRSVRPKRHVAAAASSNSDNEDEDDMSFKRKRKPTDPVQADFDDMDAPVADPAPETDPVPPQQQEPNATGNSNSNSNEQQTVTPSDMVDETHETDNQQQDVASATNERRQENGDVEMEQEEGEVSDRKPGRDMFDELMEQWSGEDEQSAMDDIDL